MDKITMIKKDAVVDIKIGSGFLKKLQELLMHVTKDISKEDIARYNEEVKKVTSVSYEFSEEWMNSVTTISFLIKNIEQSAVDQGHTYQADFEKTIKELEEQNNSSTEE